MPLARAFASAWPFLALACGGLETTTRTEQPAPEEGGTDEPTHPTVLMDGGATGGLFDDVANDASPMDLLVDAPHFPAWQGTPRCLVDEVHSFNVQTLGADNSLAISALGDGDLMLAGTAAPLATADDDRLTRAYVARVQEGEVTWSRELPAGTLAAGLTLHGAGAVWIHARTTNVPREEDPIVPADYRGSFAVRFELGGDIADAFVPLSDVQGIATHPNGNLVELRGSSPLVQAYDARANTTWSTHVESERGDSFSLAHSIAVHDDGGFHLSGYVNDDILLARFDAEAELIWAHSWGDRLSSDRGMGMTRDSVGDVWLSGSFNQADFGGGPLLRLDGFTSFLAKFDGDGEHLLSMPVPAGAHRLSVDAEDNLWFVGSDCKTQHCELSPSVVSFGPEGELRCTLPLDNHPSAALIAVGNGAWLVSRALSEFPGADLELDGGVFLAHLKGAE